jgi:hypothetical protein
MRYRLMLAIFQTIYKNNLFCACEGMEGARAAMNQAGPQEGAFL